MLPFFLLACSLNRNPHAIAQPVEELRWCFTNHVFSLNAAFFLIATGPCMPRLPAFCFTIVTDPRLWNVANRFVVCDYEVKHLPLPLPLVLYSKNLFFFLAAVSQIWILIFAQVILQGKRRDDFFTALVPFPLAKEHILVRCQPIYVQVAVHMCVPLSTPNLHLYNPWFDFAKICFHRRLLLYSALATSFVVYLDSKGRNPGDVLIFSVQATYQATSA